MHEVSEVGFLSFRPSFRSRGSVSAFSSRSFGCFPKELIGSSTSLCHSLLSKQRAVVYSVYCLSGSTLFFNCVPSQFYFPCISYLSFMLFTLELILCLDPMAVPFRSIGVRRAPALCVWLNGADRYSYSKPAWSSVHSSSFDIFGLPFSLLPYFELFWSVLRILKFTKWS